MPDSDKPNLDLIAMVQAARMQHDSTVQPSQVSGVYWIECKAPPDVRQPTPRAGRWLIATHSSRVDALWAKIRLATEAGTLGYKSKVTTAPAPGQPPDARVIAVCTYDRDDRDDVTRVRDALLALDLTEEMGYTAED